MCGMCGEVISLYLQIISPCVPAIILRGTSLYIIPNVTIQYLYEKVHTKIYDSYFPLKCKFVYEKATILKRVKLKLMYTKKQYSK